MLLENYTWAREILPWWHRKALTQWPPFLNVIVPIRSQVYACWKWPSFHRHLKYSSQFLGIRVFVRQRECRFYTAGCVNKMVVSVTRPRAVNELGGPIIPGREIWYIVNIWNTISDNSKLCKWEILLYGVFISPTLGPNVWRHIIWPSWRPPTYWTFIKPTWYPPLFQFQSSIYLHVFCSVSIYINYFNWKK